MEALETYRAGVMTTNDLDFSDRSAVEKFLKTNRCRRREPGMPSGAHEGRRSAPACVLDREL